jgi:hypothetical protein
VITGHWVVFVHTLVPERGQMSLQLAGLTPRVGQETLQSWREVVVLA